MQTSLLPAPTSLPIYLIEQIAGIASRWAFGDNPTKAQRSDAIAAAKEAAQILARLKT